MQRAHHLRSNAVNAECNQLVAVGNLQAFRAQIVDELGIDTEDAELDELVAVKIGEMLAFHLLCELGTDVLYRHRELLLFIHVKAERLHLSRVVRIRLKVEQSRAFTVLEKALAIDLARIARNGEVNVLPSRPREVDTLKRTHWPVGAVVRLATVMMLDQRELDLIPKIRFADRPVAAANFRRAILDSREEHQATEYEESKS